MKIKENWWTFYFKTWEGPTWPWSYGSWIYNFLCN